MMHKKEFMKQDMQKNNKILFDKEKNVTNRNFSIDFNCGINCGRCINLVSIEPLEDADDR